MIMQRGYLWIRHCVMNFLREMIWRSSKFIKVNNNKIVVSCYKGRGYCDNPKYIIEQVLKKDDKVKVVWLVKDKKEAESLPERVVPCYINHLSAIYHYITALIWIDNTRKDIPFRKKDSQFYMQTWHGGGALKKVEKDAEEQLSDVYIEWAKKDSSATDLFIAEGGFYSESYRNAFWYNGVIAEIGLPRYELILEKCHDVVLRKKVHDYFGIGIEQKVVLYAPTFRKGYGFESYNIDHLRLIKTCEKKFGGEFVSFVHLHPNVANKFEELEYDNKKIFNATYYPDMQELIAVADVMISDYSSAIVDFSLSRKPAFRYATDAFSYQNERGGYFDMRTGYPFPISTNNDELEACISDFNEKEYLLELDAYYDKIGININKESSSLCAEMLLDYMKNPNKKSLFEKYIKYLKNV